MERNVLITIVIAALVTSVMRVVPILLLSRFRLATIVQQWLSFIPVGIMASIVATELIEKPALTTSGLSLSLIAALITAVIGIVTRSLFATVLAGMVAYIALRYSFGL